MPGARFEYNKRKQEQLEKETVQLRGRIPIKMFQAFTQKRIKQHKHVREIFREMITKWLKE